MLRQEIIELRKSLGLSQEDFARLCGVKLGSVYRWEKGLTWPGLQAMRRIKELQAKNSEGK